MLTSIQAAKVDKSNPVSQDVGLGTRVRETELYSPVVIQCSITGAANSTAASFTTAPCNFTIIDVIVRATATSENGTVTVRTGTTSISNAIAMATNHAITRAGSLDDAQVAVTKGTVLNAITAASGDRGVVTIIGIRTE